MDNVNKIERHKLATFTHSSKGLQNQGIPFPILKANNGGSGPSNLLDLSDLLLLGNSDYLRQRFNRDNTRINPVKPSTHNFTREITEDLT